jgi:hypothetical protein
MALETLGRGIVLRDDLEILGPFSRVAERDPCLDQN